MSKDTSRSHRRELPDYLLKTRLLVPARPRTLLRRERLLAALHENTERRLVLISAPAGFGKTSLLIDFAQDTQLPVCWYSVDELHGDERLFLEYLAAAIHRRFPKLRRSRTFRWIGDASRPWDRVGFLTSLINDIEEFVDDYFVLVIDDFHLVENRESIARSLDWFLQRVGPNCCVILSTRGMPEVSFLQLAAQGQVFGIGTQELRFTAREVQELFEQNFGVRVPDKESIRLAEVSEGWITGLLLSTQRMWHSAANLLLSARRARGGLFEYLAREVLGAQERDIQEFLLGSSILSDITPSICDEVLGISTSTAILSTVEKRNLFIARVDEKAAVYRYHPLFRDFLMHELHTRVDKSLLQPLHLRAARSFGARGRWEEAIPHLVQAKAGHEAAKIMEEMAPEAILQGRVANLAQWIDALPSKILAAHPYLLCSRGEVAVERGELAYAERLLRRALRIFVGRRDRRGSALALLQLSRLHRSRGDLGRALLLAHRALERLQKGAGSNKRLEARALRALGVLYGMKGNLEKSIIFLRQAHGLCVELGEEASGAYVAISLGTALRHSGKLVEADRYYLQALEVWQHLGNLAEEARILDNLAVGHYYEGDYVRALEVFEQALGKASEVSAGAEICNIAAGKADVYRELGRLGEAKEKYRECIRIASKMENWSLVLYATDGLTETLRRDGDLPGAWASLERARELMRQGASDLDRMRVYTTFGLLLADSERVVEGKAWLQKSQRLAARAGATRELTRTLLGLGVLELRFGSRGKAMGYVRRAIELVKEGRMECLLLNETANTLLQWAAAEGILPDYVAHLLARLETASAPALPAAETRRPALVADRLEIRALGGGRVSLGGKELARGSWVARQARELFFLLVDSAPQSREQLGLVFWPDLSAERMRSVFHATLYRLRKVLRGEWIVFDPVRNVYKFNRESEYRYDVESFERALASARRRHEEPESALSEYRTAINVYAGEFLPEIDAEWANLRREYLAQSFISGLAEAARLLLKLGDPARAAEYLNRAIDVEPYREDLLRLAMVALTMANRRADALELYETSMARLTEEMGMAGSAETARLAGLIRDGTVPPATLIAFTSQ